MQYGENNHSKIVTSATNDNCRLNISLLIFMLHRHESWSSLGIGLMHHP